MDLYHRPDPVLTRWIIEKRPSQVVVDIGCQGWWASTLGFFSDCLEFYGFDPIT